MISLAWFSVVALFSYFGLWDVVRFHFNDCEGKKFLVVDAGGLSYVLHDAIFNQKDLCILVEGDLIHQEGDATAWLQSGRGLVLHNLHFGVL